MTAPEKTAKILVVDDEEQIRRALKSILSARKYEVILAEDGEQAIDLAIDHNPDMIILDISMPGLDGIEVCRELRSWYTGPILVLSVKAGDADKITALDTGADDYLTKPFSAGELLARVRAQLRRTAATVVSLPVIAVDELEIDIPHRRVKRSGEDIELTRIEFDILAFLALNPDCVVTSKMILDKVWGPEYGDDTQTLRVHISHLRKKIEPHPSVPRYILTELGVGFRFATT
jgi:two-component system, OmpR family, KDP operon response regulator KdpE